MEPEFRPAEGISSPNATGIGASHRGLWVTYTVQVQKTGDYRVTAFLAGAGASARVRTAAAEGRMVPRRWLVAYNACCREPESPTQHAHRRMP
jgi:hypothetical protein